MPSAEDFLDAKEPDVSACVTGIVGEEPFLRGDVLATLVAGIKHQHGDTDVIRLDHTADWATVVAELRSVGLFGGHRVVVIDDPGGKQSFVDKQKDKLAEYLDAPAKRAQLILRAEKIDGRSKFAKALPQKGLRIECDRLKPASLVRWLTQRAKKLHRLELPRHAAEFFVECVGDRMGVLASELEKLDLFLDPPEGKKLRKVELDTLDAVLGYRGSATTWALVDRMAAADLAGSLHDTHVLLENGESPFALIGAVAYRLKTLWRAAGYQACGLRGQEITTAMKLPPFQRQALLSALPNFDLPTCRAVLDHLCEADRKANPIPPELAFELFVIKLCRQLARRRPRPNP